MKTAFDRKLPAAPRDGNNYAISENACAQPREDFVGLYPADYKNFPSSVLDRASTLFSVVFIGHGKYSKTKNKVPSMRL